MDLIDISFKFVYSILTYQNFYLEVERKQSWGLIFFSDKPSQICQLQREVAPFVLKIGFSSILFSGELELMKVCIIISCFYLLELHFVCVKNPF